MKLCHFILLRRANILFSGEKNMKKSSLPLLKKRNKRNSQLFGFICIIPWLIGFLAFQLYPLVMSLIYSFTNYSLGKPLEFVGVSNYVKMFTNDREYWNSVKVTFLYVLISVPLKLAFSLLIAVILSMKIKQIHIDKYKIFQNFNIDFCTDDIPLKIIVLTGINGTGKSTLIEFISFHQIQFDQEIRYGSLTVIDDRKEKNFDIP